MASEIEFREQKPFRLAGVDKWYHGFFRIEMDGYVYLEPTTLPPDEIPTVLADAEFVGWLLDHAKAAKPDD